MSRMRIAAGVLLLLNVLIFGWTRLSSSRPTAVVSEPQLGALKLVAAQALSPTHCMSLGPFLDPTTLGAPAAALATHGLPARSRMAQHNVSGGWWVYIAGLPSKAQRRRAMENLKRAGVKEVAEITLSEGNQRISAGIFSDHDHALAVATMVRRAQLEPVVEERVTSASDWWLDADIKRESTPPALASLAAPTRATASVGWAECPPSAGGG